MSDPHTIRLKLSPEWGPSDPDDLDCFLRANGLTRCNKEYALEQIRFSLAEGFKPVSVRVVVDVEVEHE